MALRQTLLTVLTRGKMSGYEIAKNFDQVLKYFWQASHQQIYKELARLSEDGCVTCEQVTQSGKPDKKVYKITKFGIKELREWVGSDTEAFRPRNDLLVKLLAGHVIEEGVLEQEFQMLRKRAECMLKEYRNMEKVCFEVPVEKMSEYEQVMYLALRSGQIHTRARIKWLKEVEEFLQYRKNKNRTY